MKNRDPLYMIHLYYYLPSGIIILIDTSWLPLSILQRKYPHMLNAEYQSIVYTDHKPLVGFFNAEYQEDIFAYQANKLRLLNIRIQYIPEKKNMVANGLSQIIFNNRDCSPNWLVNKLSKKVFVYLDDNGWFWK